MERKRKQQWKKAGIFVTVISLTAGSLCSLFIMRTNHKKMLSENAKEERAFSSDSDDIVVAAGVTEIEMDTVTFAINFLEDTSLYVEDVYLSNGDTVAAGEAYIKFTDDSVAKARAELEKAVQNTQLAYQSKVILDGEDKIQAKYTYDAAVLEAKFAPQVYQDTLTQLEMQLVKAQKDCEEAQKEYDAYYLAIANNTFYEDYQVEKLKKAYDDAYDLFVSRRAYWEVTPEELNTLSDKNDKAQTELSDRQWIIKTVALLREEMTEAQEKYEQARQNYQQEIEGAELKLQKLLNRLERAQQSLIDAQLEHQKGSIRAKTSYELAAARGQIAQSDYHICLMNLASEREHLKAAWDEAVEKKAFFEAQVGDGYLYTDQAGTVFMTCAEKGQALAGGDPILVYVKPEEIFVSAMVPESSAAKLFTGEEARVTIADCGSFDGIVKAVCPIMASDDTTIVYSVAVVSLSGDVSMIEPNLTASVVFGAGTQDDIVQCNADAQETAKRSVVSAMYDLDIYDLNALTETDEKPANYLKVAEVYAEAGQYIKEGEPVCQFTQDSMESVRKVLTDAQSEACIALAEAQTSYHIRVLEAGLSHNEAMIDMTLAQTAYDNTIAKLNSAMVEKILETEQLLADIYQMQAAQTNDGFQRQSASITSAYEQAKKQMESAKESFVTNQVESALSFQAAKDSYEDFFNQLEASNQQIADKVEKVHALQEEILQSQQMMEKELLTAKQACVCAQTEGEIADAKYAGILKDCENALSKAQSDFDQAARRLDAFNQFVGEGTVYATGNGLVMEVGCRKDAVLVDTRELVSYVADTDISMEADEKEDTQ